MIDNDVDRRKSAQSFAWVLFFLLSAVIEVPQLVEDSPEMAKLFVRHVEFRESGFIPIPRLALDAEFKNVLHPVSDSLTETIFLMLRSVTEINFPVLSQMDDLMEHLIVIAFFTIIWELFLRIFRHFCPFNEPNLRVLPRGESGCSRTRNQGYPA